MKYDEALAVQERQRDDVLNGATDRQVVFTVEHPPTITIGRNGTSSHIVAPRAYLESLGMEVYEVDRGGDVTYHGPGQLVVYPIFHLQPWDNDVGRYVRMLEESVIVALRDVGLIASRRLPWRLDGHEQDLCGRRTDASSAVRGARHVARNRAQRKHRLEPLSNHHPVRIGR
jgi:lipoate-protein ligase B